MQYVIIAAEDVRAGDILGFGTRDWRRIIAVTRLDSGHIKLSTGGVCDYYTVKHPKEAVAVKRRSPYLE